MSGYDDRPIGFNSGFTCVDVPCRGTARIGVVETRSLPNNAQSEIVPDRLSGSNSLSGASLLML